MSNDPSFIVHVQRNAEGTVVDDYEIPPEQTPEFEIIEGEMWIQSMNPEQSTLSFVAVYARGLWLRCWIEDATDDKVTEAPKVP